MWTVYDGISHVSIDFREGLFNDTQKVNLPDDLTTEDAQKLATTMREIGDWMAQNHMELSMCDAPARCRAIYMLNNERYWLAMADAMNSLIIDWPDDAYPECLYAEMEDYIRLENGIGLNEAEATNLLGSLSLLDNDEAWEVINILYVFWEERRSIECDTWARDLLWWPAWCPAKEDEEVTDDGDY